MDPHANRDAAVSLDDDVVEPEDVPKLDKQIRITMKDLQTFGYSDRCPRCAEMRAGNTNTQKHHSRECRLRLYLCFHSSNHPKWQAVRHFFQDKEPNAKNVDEEGAPETPKPELDPGLFQDNMDQDKIDVDLPDDMFDDPPPMELS